MNTFCKIKLTGLVGPLARVVRQVVFSRRKCLWSCFTKVNFRTNLYVSFVTSCITNNDKFVRELTLAKRLYEYFLWDKVTPQALDVICVLYIATLLSCQLLDVYRGTSLTRNRRPLGPYSRTMPRALWGSQGAGRFLRSEVPLYCVGMDSWADILTSAVETTNPHGKIKLTNFRLQIYLDRS